jgi:hypothetical protein
MILRNNMLDSTKKLLNDLIPEYVQAQPPQHWKAVALLGMYEKP